MNNADFSLRDEGTIVILTPLSEAAGTWVEDHLPDDAPTFGPGVVIEHRYVAPIVEGFLADGLTVVTSAAWARAGTSIRRAADGKSVQLVSGGKS